MIKIENIRLAYGLAELSCELNQGKLIGIMGANGAGKSSLLKALAGIIPLQQGQIYFNQQPLTAMNVQQKSQNIAYLAQNTAIYWDLSAYDVIALGLLHPLKKSEEQQLVEQIAEQFSVEHLLNKTFNQLSGGEKTRVQLARCCIKNSPLLLADEPIAALDPYYQIDVMQRLKALTPKQTCLMVIHHLDLAYRYCDEIILLHQGRLLDYGATEKVLTPQNLAQAFAIQAEINIEQREIRRIDKLNTSPRHIL